MPFLLFCQAQRRSAREGVGVDAVVGDLVAGILAAFQADVARRPSHPCPRGRLRRGARLQPPCSAHPQSRPAALSPCRVLAVLAVRWPPVPPAGRPAPFAPRPTRVEARVPFCPSRRTASWTASWTASVSVRRRTPCRTPCTPLQPAPACDVNRALPRNRRASGRDSA